MTQPATQPIRKLTVSVGASRRHLPPAARTRLSVWLVGCDLRLMTNRGVDVSWRAPHLFLAFLLLTSHPFKVKRKVWGIPPLQCFILSPVNRTCGAKASGIISNLIKEGEFFRHWAYLVMHLQGTQPQIKKMGHTKEESCCTDTVLYICLVNTILCCLTQVYIFHMHSGFVIRAFEPRSLT